jgi:hypothetical protein
VTGERNSPCADAHVPARALSPRRGTQVYPTSAQALPKANAYDTCAFTAASTHSSRQGLLKRMDITGARWGLEGAEAVLKLRALIATGDFDAYWRFHLRREHERIHHAKYRDTYILAA